MQAALIYKSNALVEASYRLSLYEQRIVLACIAQVRRNESLTDQQLYTVSAQQIADMAGIGLKTAYRHLKEASERLFDRRVTLHEAPNGEGRPAVRLTRWVQEIVYREDQGAVALRFSQPMVPYLSQLSAQFTHYALADVATMTSGHGMRLYELLCQWRDAGQREVSLEWLRETLQLGERYPNIRDLKRRVIQPAVDQVNEHSPLWCKWDQRKTGRRVSHLVFTFGEKTKPKPKKSRKVEAQGRTSNDSNGSIYGISMVDIKAHAKPGESESDAALRLLDERKREA